MKTLLKKLFGKETTNSVVNRVQSLNHVQVIDEVQEELTFEQRMRLKAANYKKVGVRIQK